MTGYLKSIEVSQARTVARLLIEQLRSRNFILCYLGADSYAFVHRTFLEYFCACEFVERFGKRGLEGGLTLEELKTEVFGKHWQDESWHEVLRLIAGMIDTSFAGQIIDYLMALDGEAQKFINLFLAAECLSEVRNRTEIKVSATKLLNQLKDLIQYFKKLTPSKLVSLIANTWKDELDTLPWLKACTFLEEVDSSLQQTAIKEIARGWKDDFHTLPWLKSITQIEQSQDKGELRFLAAVELYYGWKNDPEIVAYAIEVLASKFSSLRTKITDAEILKDSLYQLGIVVKTNAEVRSFHYRIQCDIVAVLEGECDLGWSRNNDGSFDLIANLWGLSLKQNQIKLINSINQKYALNRTLKEAQER
jgi:hypothetical protein